MLDLSFIFEHPLLAWMFAEGNLNDGSPSGFGITHNILQAYRPDADTFKLPVCQLLKPEDAIRIGVHLSEPEGSQPRPAPVPIYIHPQFFDSLWQHSVLRQSSVRYVTAKASSSVRTAWILEDGMPQSFVKMHFPEIIGRFRRDLKLYGWLASIENSKVISSAISASRPHAPSGFALLRETGGTFVEGDGVIEGFGHIERELTPYPRRADQNRAALIPFFSLSAGAMSQGHDRTLLTKIIVEMGATYDQVISSLIVPLLEGYEYCALQIGLIPECNAQNLLWEVDSSLRACRVVHRDLMGFFKDLDTGLVKDTDSSPLISYHSIGRNLYSDTKLRRSFAFDFKLAKYTLDPLVELLAAHFAKSPISVQADVRDIARQSIPWPDDYFPDDQLAYGYPNEERVNRGGYVSIGAPRYR